MPGLTNDNPKEILTTLQLMADIKTALAAAPDWENLVKKAYALSEKEQARADAALKAITDNQNVLVDIKKQQDALDSAQADMEGSIAENNAILRRIEEGSRKQDKRKSEQDARDEEQNQREGELQKREDALVSGQAQLAQGNADLASRERAMRALEADLKKRAEQMQQATQGL